MITIQKRTWDLYMGYGGYWDAQGVVWAAYYYALYRVSFLIGLFKPINILMG